MAIMISMCISFPACSKSEANNTEEPKYVISYGVDDETIKAIKGKYSGLWYGWSEVNNVLRGDLTNGRRLDICAYFDFDTLFPDSPVASVIICDCNASFVVADFTTQVGASDSWCIGGARILGSDPAYMKHWFHEGVPNMLVIGGKVETPDSSYTIEFYLRPWGTIWDDVIAIDPTGIPSNYDSWYLPSVNSKEELVFSKTNSAM